MFLVVLFLWDSTLQQQQTGSISVEYMFKLSTTSNNNSKSKYGLVKSSMLANSVAAIVKLSSSSQTLRLLDEENEGEAALLFHVKEFVPKHYMIRLSRDASRFERRHLEALRVKTSIADVALEFRLVIEDDRLDIVLAEERLSASVSVYENMRGDVHSLRYEDLSSDDWRVGDEDAILRVN